MSEVQQIPEVVAQALAHTAVDVKPLVKNDKNAFQNYSYVSIDDYYLNVPKIALSKGLTWIIREVDTKPFTLTGKKGPETAMIFTYEVDLVHVDGHYIRGYDRISIYHPAQGAQTSGSARSYADKLFMRTAFKIATGEHELRDLDADATDNSWMSTDKSVDMDDGWGDLEPSSPPEPEDNADKDPVEVITDEMVNGVGPKFHKPKTSDDAALIVEVFRQFMPTHNDPDTLRRFWTINKEALDTLKGIDADAYQKLYEDFAKHGKSLKGKKE